MRGLGDVAERLRRSTLRIISGRRGQGSGVVWSADGKILTNAHVIASRRPTAELWDGREASLRILALDRRRDLALLQADSLQLDAPQYRDSNDVRAGELAVAVGNPLGFSGAVSTGVVHAVGPLGALGRRPWIQASVRLAPGNSGGPLADEQGRVIGVNTMVVGGLGLAAPSSVAADFVARGPAPRLGVTLQPLPVHRGDRAALGLRILEVEPESLAASAGLRPGDALLAINGRRIEAVDDLADALEDPAGELALAFVRDGSTRLRQISVRLSPAEAAA